MKDNITTVDDYIASFPEDVRNILSAIRSIIKEEAAESVEAISYGMPGYKTNNKPLVYFAGYKNHIGLYATPSGHQTFAKELSGYKQGKGSVQFQLNEEMPYDLIRRIVAFRVNENRNKN